MSTLFGDKKNPLCSITFRVSRAFSPLPATLDLLTVSLKEPKDLPRRGLTHLESNQSPDPPLQDPRPSRTLHPPQLDVTATASLACHQGLWVRRCGPVCQTSRVAPRQVGTNELPAASGVVQGRSGVWPSLSRIRQSHPARTVWLWRVCPGTCFRRVASQRTG